MLEKFTYDALNRLQSSTLNGAGDLAVAYDASGNVTSRSDVGNYAYGDPAHPHAATAAGSHTYTYDANGNQITRDGASQAWASFNLPVQLTQPIGGTTYQSQINYGPSHQRWKQIASYANGTGYHALRGRTAREGEHDIHRKDVLGSTASRRRPA